MTKSKKKTRRSVRPRKGSTWRRWLWLTLSGFFLALTLYVIYLDHIVQIRFDGRRWMVPAKVYGRSLQLTPGTRLDEARLLRELEGLGYRRVKHPNSPGSYSSYRGRFLLRTRPFQFTGPARPSEYLEILLQHGRLQTLKQAATSQSVERYLLEPRLIGSLYPTHSEDRVLLRAPSCRKAWCRPWSRWKTGISISKPGSIRWRSCGRCGPICALPGSCRAAVP